MMAQADGQSNESSLRIQKHLANLGLASRREAERWISEGRVAVNGQKLLQQGCKVDPSVDRITIDGEAIPLTAPPKIYWLFHKPDRTICSTKAQAEDKITIFDIPKIKKVPFKLTFAGRLDFRSEGLMLLSNDGALIQKLTHPSSKVPRSYYVLAKGKLNEEQILQIKRGITLEDGPVKDVDIKYTHGKNL